MAERKTISPERKTISPDEIAGAPAHQLPSIQRQKTFIINNADNLSREIKMVILSLVMMEVGPGVASDVKTAAKEVNINLDEVEKRNGEVLAHIYNIICAHREQLNQPSAATRQSGKA